jgi:type IV pilus assembly protein PilV
MMPSRSIFHPTTGQRGMTLIEILVAVVVLSIGLLGLAGLQLKGLQVNQGSTYRWQAAMLAEDIADRMRADSASALAGNYTMTFGSTAPPGGGGAGTQATIGEWLARVAALPNGKAGITVTPPNVVQIDMGWDDTRANSGVSSGSRTVVSTPSTVVVPLFTLRTELWD